VKNGIIVENPDIQVRIIVFFKSISHNLIVMLIHTKSEGIKGEHEEKAYRMGNKNRDDKPNSSR
jgi:hypothetical protein